MALRVAGINFDHMHMGDLLRQVHDHPGATIAGVCDADAGRMAGAIAAVAIPSDRVFTEVSRDYPAIRTESLLVDAACMDLVRRPQDFDVIVASNLFGDILTDLSAAITGSIGLAPSANLNPSKTFPSLFEPVHGSAPDIAGRGIANPMATMLAGSMMLDFLGESAAAVLLDRAVIQVLTDRRQLTPDLGGTGTTTTVADEVLAQVRRDAGR